MRFEVNTVDIFTRMWFLGLNQFQLQNIIVMSENTEGNGYRPSGFGG